MQKQNADIGSVTGSTYDEFERVFGVLRDYRESIRERHDLTFAQQKKQEEQYGKVEFERRLSVLERHAAKRAAQEPEGEDLVSAVSYTHLTLPTIYSV